MILKYTSVPLTFIRFVEHINFLKKANKITLKKHFNDAGFSRIYNIMSDNGNLRKQISDYLNNSLKNPKIDFYFGSTNIY